MNSIEFLIKNKFIQIAVVFCTPALIAGGINLWLQLIHHEHHLATHSLRLQALEVEDIRTVETFEGIRTELLALKLSLVQIGTTQKVLLRYMESLMPVLQRVLPRDLDS